MTSFARIEEERVFLERCERLYHRVQKIKARVDNATPTCMYGSFLGKRNELRKSLASAGTARAQASEEDGIEILEYATIEEKIEHFFLQIKYKNTSRTEGRKFPYLRQPARLDPVPPVPTDLLDVHSIAFTRSYPRILRHHQVGSKLRQMPLFYQKVSVSSSEETKSDKLGDDRGVLSPQEVSNADTTHGIPPMESTTNSPLLEESDSYMSFLNDVTDVILGMNIFSASAIDAAIDAILATNLYGDLDKERARLLVDQLLT
ncbi:uncharacterized protein LOC114828385 [Galendromus occidentalis]|uniref:Uncharacterized protein LOC114828385 n=1 Tax=Galendromus occidentalis TaxID=34638 RepID=A0AAJ7SHG0_9ACAR|nr:uncharacterized protein LOC114828385 [Galendromus occidentalis]